jgi:hypothetical protein
MSTEDANEISSVLRQNVRESLVYCGDEEREANKISLQGRCGG